MTHNFHLKDEPKSGNKFSINVFPICNLQYLVDAFIFKYSVDNTRINSCCPFQLSLFITEIFCTISAYIFPHILPLAQQPSALLQYKYNLLPEIKPLLFANSANLSAMNSNHGQ